MSVYICVCMYAYAAELIPIIRERPRKGQNMCLDYMYQNVFVCVHMCMYMCVCKREYVVELIPIIRERPQKGKGMYMYYVCMYIFIYEYVYLHMYHVYVY